jgi:serine/threonine protein kinase
MAAELRPGSTFAGYRIEELVGVGGMGHVYRATELENERAVALKLLLPRLTSDAGFRARFERESRLAVGLEHPHVVRVHAAGEADGVLYLVMEHVAGVDLGAIIADRDRLHPRHAALLVSQVGSALDAADGQGLVHRDVKPGNVLVVDREGSPHAYLADFGLSKRADSVSGLTRTGQWVGTIDYAAPEQLQAEDVDHRTDVYALGALLYHALTGEVPFPRERDVDKLVAHLSDPPPVVTNAAPDVPGRFDEIVQRAMAKRPEDRYESAGDLGRDALAAAGDASPAPPWVQGPRRHGDGGAPADPNAPTAA